MLILTCGMFFEKEVATENEGVDFEKGMYAHLHTRINSWKKLHAEPVCFFRNKKKLSKALLTCTFIIPWLLNSFHLPSYSSELSKRSTLRLLLMCLEALREEFSWWDWEGISRKLWSLVKLYQRIWIRNLDQNLTKRFSFQNVQNKVFGILKMFKNNMKFTRAACWINLKISNRDNNTTSFPIFLCYHHYWLLLWCYYWRSFML